MRLHSCCPHLPFFWDHIFIFVYVGPQNPMTIQSTKRMPLERLHGEGYSSINVEAAFVSVLARNLPDAPSWIILFIVYANHPSK
jgi:hypothetical protein